MSKEPNLSENDLFKMSSPPIGEKNKKTDVSSEGASDVDSLRDFMRASSTRTSERKESFPDPSYQPSIYKKPAEENMESPPENPKPNPVIDYRKNVQRQVREQKKVGSALGTLAYGALGLLIVFGVLASYGAYVIFGELRMQKATAQQIQQKLTGQIEALQANLMQTQTALETHSKQSNEMLVALQEKLETQNKTFQSAIAIERKNREVALRTRDDQASELRQRIRRLENRY